MARRYHMTETGPKPCRARPGNCPLDHSDTREGAVAQHEANIMRRDNKRRQQELQQEFQNLTKDQKVTGYYNMIDRGHYGRMLANDVQEIYNRTGARPEYVDGLLFTEFKDSTGVINVEVSAQKSYEIVGNPAHISPVWNLRIKEERAGVLIEDKSERYPLTTQNEGRQLNQGMYRLVTDGLDRANISSSEAEAKRSQVMDSFINGVKSIETLERGAPEAQNLGFSYFKGSDDNRIIARADYAETAISPKDLEDVIESGQYRTKDPDVQIMIQDSDAKTSKAYWTASYKDDKWSISTVDRDGNASVQPVRDSEQASQIVHDFSISEMNFNKERAVGSANFIEEFVEDTDAIRERHRIRLDRSRQSEQEKLEIDRRRKEHLRLYSGDNRSKKPDSLFGKMLDALS